MCKVASLFMIFERIPTVIRFPLTSFSHLITIDNKKKLCKHYQTLSKISAHFTQTTTKRMA